MTCTLRGMDLAAWMKNKDLTDAKLASEVGYSRVSIGRFRRKLEPIPTPLVKRFVAMSGGQMTADELIGISEAAE